MRQPTIHQMREKKHRGKVKEVEKFQYLNLIQKVKSNNRAPKLIIVVFQVMKKNFFKMCDRGRRQRRLKF
jgi:hypothetical protein